jgi:hypothetical protein
VIKAFAILNYKKCDTIAVSFNLFLLNFIFFAFSELPPIGSNGMGTLKNVNNY